MKKTLLLIFLLFLSCSNKVSEQNIINQINQKKEEFKVRLISWDEANNTVALNDLKAKAECLKTEKIDKRYMVKLNNKIGYIDGCGRKITEAKYDFGFDFIEGLAAVKKGDKYSFINMDGKEITDFIYDDVSFFSEGLARVEIEGKWGFIDKTGNLKIKPQYDWTYNFHDGYTAAKTKAGMEIIDKNGKSKFKRNFQHAGIVINNKFAFGGIESEGNGLVMGKGVEWVIRYYHDYVSQKFNDTSYFDDVFVKIDAGFIVEENSQKMVIDENENIIFTLKRR